MRRRVVDRGAAEGGLFDSNGGWVRGFDAMLRMAWETRRKRGGGLIVA